MIRSREIMPTIRLLVCGASGRMGLRVLALASADDRFAISARVSRATADTLSESLGSADVVIDFSVPEASLRAAALCAQAKKPIAIGTTGFTKAQQEKLASLAGKTAIFLAPNFSPGVFVLGRLAAEAARALAGWDAAISETHHKTKKDAPSGTALSLAATVASARGGGTVPSASLRVGDVVGEHTLTLAGPFERLELTHRAHSRDLFAAGALDAAAWLAGRKPGLYGMGDFLKKGVK